MSSIDAAEHGSDVDYRRLHIAPACLHNKQIDDQHLGGAIFTQHNQRWSTVIKVSTRALSREKETV